MADQVRRGAATLAAVRPAVLHELEAGRSASATHVEQMALDMGNLLQAWAPELAHLAPRLRDLAFLDRLRAGGRVLVEVHGADASSVVIGATSDTVRGWGAFAVGVVPHVDLAVRLRRIRVFRPPLRGPGVGLVGVAAARRRGPSPGGATAGRVGPQRRRERPALRGRGHEAAERLGEPLQRAATGALARPAAARRGVRRPAVALGHPNCPSGAPSQERRRHSLNVPGRCGSVQPAN